MIEIAFFDPDSGEPPLVLPIKAGEVLQLGRRHEYFGMNSPVRTFTISSPDASRRHAEIRCLENLALMLVDCGSERGTKLNQENCASHVEYPLKAGDEVQISRFRFLIRAGQVRGKTR